MSQTLDQDVVAAVVIGRNEGERLKGCLNALSKQVDKVVYVDSGSTDGSVAAAKLIGAHVVALDMAIPFTAARARNAGVAEVARQYPAIVYIQFVDGDCEVVPGWMQEGLAALEKDSNLAAVCGRLRERSPEVSIYNRILDEEWNTQVGDLQHCGGIALMRRQMFEAVDGFRNDLIAGEEPELCFRFRQQGWRIRRLAADMALHDAAMTRFSQWWRRTKRSGHTYAEGAALHGRTPERYRVRELGRTLMWGAVLPLFIVFGAFSVSPWVLGLALLWPLQAWRIRRRGKSWWGAIFTVLGKFPETLGVLGYARGYLTQSRVGLIEYK